jgi:amino acid permease
MGEPPSTIQFIANYITIPLFAMIFFGYKFYYKTEFVKLDQCDLTSGHISILEETGKINSQEKSI